MKTENHNKNSELHYISKTLLKNHLSLYVIDASRLVGLDRIMCDLPGSLPADRDLEPAIVVSELSSPVLSLYTLPSFLIGSSLHSLFGFRNIDWMFPIQTCLESRVD